MDNQNQHGNSGSGHGDVETGASRDVTATATTATTEALENEGRTGEVAVGGIDANAATTIEIANNESASDWNNAAAIDNNGLETNSGQGTDNERTIDDSNSMDEEMGILSNVDTNDDSSNHDNDFDAIPPQSFPPLPSSPPLPSFDDQQEQFSFSNDSSSDEADIGTPRPRQSLGERVQYSRAMLASFFWPLFAFSCLLVPGIVVMAITIAVCLPPFLLLFIGGCCFYCFAPAEYVEALRSRRAAMFDLTWSVEGDSEAERERVWTRDELEGMIDLRVVVETKEHNDDNDNNGDQSKTVDIDSLDECGICLLEYQVGEEVAFSRHPDCPHEFHKDCLLDWMAKKQICPTCRRPYRLVDGEGTQNNNNNNNDNDGSSG